MTSTETQLRDWKNEYVNDILIGATESGCSSHWFTIDWDSDVWSRKSKDMFYSDYAMQLLLEGKALEIKYVVPYVDEMKKSTLTLQQFIDGYEQNKRERPFDADLEGGRNLDAYTYDCILQFSIFNEIVFV